MLTSFALSLVIQKFAIDLDFIKDSLNPGLSHLMPDRVSKIAVILILICNYFREGIVFYQISIADCRKIGGQYRIKG